MSDSGPAAPELPGDGEPWLGPVRLPAGRRVMPLEGEAPVAWVTRDTVPDPGPVWSELSDRHGQTGLVPVILQDDGDDIDDVFYDPCDVAEADHLDPAELLAARWEGELDDEFPGLAPPTSDSPDSAEQVAALSAIGPARIGLIPARRPADVLAVVGWVCFDDPAYSDGIRNAIWIGAILRSWEDRFAARLLTIGPGAEISLLVRRPPRTIDEARQIAEEHSAFCTECAGRGLRWVRDIAPALLDAPVWTFWWD